MSSVKDVCTKDVQYVSPDTKIDEVARRMKEHNCGSILVGEGDTLTGVITDHDIVLRCVADSQDPTTMEASQCQSPNILYCYEDDDVEEALRNMADNQIRRLPVLNSDKRLVGIVSFGDLSAACDHKEVSGQAMEQIRKAA